MRDPTWIGRMEEAVDVERVVLERLAKTAGAEGRVSSVRFAPLGDDGFMCTSPWPGGMVSDIELSNNLYDLRYIDERGNSIFTRWQPSEAVRFALQKIHQGRPLLFPEEGALAGLYHEIQHAAQKFAPQGTFAQELMCEVVNEWTARRCYPKLLEALGVKARHQKQIIEQGFGQADRVRNFEKLLADLGVKDTKSLLDGMVGIIENAPTDTYLEEVTKLLMKQAEKAGKKPSEAGIIYRLSCKIKLNTV